MLTLSLCDYSDAHLLIKGTTRVTGAGADDAAIQLNKIDKGVIFKHCAPFTNYINKINNTQKR